MAVSCQNKNTPEGNRLQVCSSAKADTEMKPAKQKLYYRMFTVPGDSGLLGERQNIDGDFRLQIETDLDGDLSLAQRFQCFRQ